MVCSKGLNRYGYWQGCRHTVPTFPNFWQSMQGEISKAEQIKEKKKTQNSIENRPHSPPSATSQTGSLLSASSTLPPLSFLPLLFLFFYFLCANRMDALLGLGLGRLHGARALRLEEWGMHGPSWLVGIVGKHKTRRREQRKS